MEITNKYGLPAPIYRAICHNWYSGANDKVFCTATQIIKPIKLTVLQKRYQKEIVRDAINLIWTLDGSAYHEVLKKSEYEKSMVEGRLFGEIDGKLISGGFDNYEDKTISDYKNTSVNQWFYKSNFIDYERQLNIYSWLFSVNKIPVEKLEIIFKFKDWSAKRAEIEDDYPFVIEQVNIPKWSLSDIEDYIRGRVGLIEKALEMKDDDIPHCSMEDRWQDVPRFAVMKGDNKRATKVFEDKKEAEEFLSDHKDKSSMRIETREGMPLRCKGKTLKDGKEIIYCDVREYCSFYLECVKDKYQ